MASSSSSTTERRLKRADPSTLQDKFLVGYQGWFTCAGDGQPVGPGHHGWLHWFNFPMPDGGRPNTDLWPDVSSYSPSELYPAPGLKTKTGEQVFLFSSRNGKTVQRHFRWMAEHGVDGAFLQRFAGQTDLETGNEGIRRIRDEVGDRVREAAEKEGRVFAIMYDVSGVPADRIARVLEQDWAHLVREKGVLDSPNYLKEKGKPVIALWGFGFDGAGHTPALLRSIVANLRSVTPGGAYIMAGVPAHWRTSEGDADRNPEFVDVWLNEFDAISPWTIGRYSSEYEADNFAETKMKGDSELLKRRTEGGHRKVDYIPVVFPGGSGYNLSEGKWSWNGIKRNGGRFLWKQIYNARKFGVRTMYGAMWDEYDEGTAFMPVVPHKRLVPESDKFNFMALDVDGYDLPADWYMRICGFAAEVLRDERRIFETFPSKELQDYWSTRPKYEDVPIQPVASGSGANAGGSAAVLNTDAGGCDSDSAKPAGSDQSYDQWLASQNDEKQEAPPPPYSLEAEDVPATAPTTTSAGTASAASTATSPNTNTAAAATAATTLNSASTGATSTPGSHSGSANLPPASNPPHPVVNVLTYPGQHPPNTGFGTPDSVASLANDFGRVNISPSISPGPNNTGNSSSFPPPPLHPSHPANRAGHGFGRPVPQPSPRPSSSAGRPPPPVNMTTRPPNVTQPPVVGYPPSVHQTPPPQQQSQPPESNSSGPWSQAQWPPSDWKVNTPSSHSTSTYTPYHPYGAQGGANLSRPQSYSAGSGHDHSPSSLGANLRPSTTVCGGRPSYSGPSSPAPSSAGPSFPGGPGPGRFGGPGTSSYHDTPPTSPYSPSPASGGSTYPGQRPTSPYPTPTSPYPGQPGSAYPGQQSYNSTYPGQHGSSSVYHDQPTSPGQPPYPPHQSYFPHHSHHHHGSPTQSPPGPISYPSATTDSSTGSPGGFHSTYPSPHAPYAGPGAPHGMPFPSGPGEYGSSGHGYGSGSGPSFPGGPTPQSGYGGYPTPSQNQQYGHLEGASSSSSFPQPGGTGPSNTSPPGPGPWMPGTGGHSSPPPFPPRPNDNSYYKPTSSSGPNFPTTSTAGQQAIGLAMSAVNMVAGKKTGEKIGAALGKFTR